MRTESDRRMIQVWQEVLRNGRLDESSDFLSAGSTSLTAVRIRSYIREKLGKDVTIEEILRNSSPRAIVAAAIAAPEGRRLVMSGDPPDGPELLHELVARERPMIRTRSRSSTVSSR
jgi:hypothetical protein